MESPAGEAEYDPPLCPLWDTVAVPVEQYGEPGYTIAAVGRALILMGAVVVLEQVPLL